MSAPAATAAAYRQCESITRSQAANFYYGIRLLRHDRRRAMCAVYAFARRVDDIGDGALEREEKLRRLDQQAHALSELGAPDPRPPAASDAVFVALADASQRFALQEATLGELIEGVRMDVDGVTYESFDDLVLYCRRVAGAIGRVCLAIFGTRERDSTRAAGAEALADDLGVALQLTNILRDVREDAENGRVYLPAEDLRRFGLLSADDAVATPAVLASLLADEPGAGSNGLPPSARDARGADGLSALVRFEASRAEEWFQRGMQLVPLLDRRSAACVLAMAGIYRRLLERIEAHPERALRERVSLPTHEKAWVAIHSMLGGGG